MSVNSPRAVGRSRKPENNCVSLRAVPQRDDAFLREIERDAAMALAGLAALRDRLGDRGGVRGAEELRVAEALARVDDALADAVRSLYAGAAAAPTGREDDLEQEA